MNHQGTILIETDRLILRRFVVEDAKEMYQNWASEDEVTKYLTWPTHQNVGETEMILKSWIEKYDNSDFYVWGIELKESGKLVGNISVVAYSEEKQTATLGWCMGSKWWGNGIMPEAAKAVIKYLFMEVGFNRIGADHDIENPKSGRVMQKVGMKYEGTLRANGKNNRGIIDEVWYSILRDEYIEKNGLPTGREKVLV